MESSMNLEICSALNMGKILSKKQQSTLFHLLEEIELSKVGKLSWWEGYKKEYGQLHKWTH